MYYRADIHISTEQLEWDAKEKAYTGVDPDTYQSHGSRQLIARTLEELKEKIRKEYFNLDKPIGADVQIFDGAIEIVYEGEHDYRTPKKEQIPFIETARITICEVKEKYLDLAKEPLFKKIPRS